MKPTINEIEIAKKIVNELLERKLFEAIISTDHDSFYNWCGRNEIYLDTHCIRTFCGETKLCIVPKELDNWVIKAGFVDCEDGYNTPDFCAAEANNFADASKRGLEEFFAASYELCAVTPPEIYGYKGDIHFYIQEKAMPDEDRTSSTCDSYMRGSKSEDDDNEDCYYDEYYDYDDEDRLESLFRDNAKYDELTMFIHEFEINDLHSGNFGYTANGEVKIIDYSGYYE